MFTHMGKRNSMEGEIKLTSNFFFVYAALAGEQWELANIWHYYKNVFSEHSWALRNKIKQETLIVNPEPNCF